MNHIATHMTVLQIRKGAKRTDVRRRCSTALACLLGCAAVGIGGCEDTIDVAELKPAAGNAAILQQGEGRRGTGWWPDLIFDADDQPHLSYCDADAGKLRYATRKDGRWRVTTPIKEGNVGKYTAIAIDAQGKPAIAFHDQDSKHLNYLFKDAAGAWQVEEVAWGKEVGMASELRFDPEGRANLFYYTPTGRLMHARRAGPESWDKTTVAKASGGFSMRIDVVRRTDGFWLSFVDDQLRQTVLSLAKPAASGSDQDYVVNTVDDYHGPGWRSQLFFEEGAPLLLFTRTFNETLHVGRKKPNGEWATPRLARRVGNFAAARTPAGDIVVGYQDTSRGRTRGGVMRILRREAGQWEHYAVDETPWSGRYLDLAVNSKGKAMLVYFSRDIRGLKVYSETRADAAAIEAAKAAQDAKQAPPAPNAAAADTAPSGPTESRRTAE